MVSSSGSRVSRGRAVNSALIMTLSFQLRRYSDQSIGCYVCEDEARQEILAEVAAFQAQ